MAINQVEVKQSRSMERNNKPVSSSVPINQMIPFSKYSPQQNLIDTSDLSEQSSYELLLESSLSRRPRRERTILTSESYLVCSIGGLQRLVIERIGRDDTYLDKNETNHD